MDRFVAELSPVAHGQAPKDADLRYGALLHGLDYVRIKVRIILLQLEDSLIKFLLRLQTFPPEKFDEASEFVESLARAFDNAHGFGLKSAFAEALVRLLHPIGKV
jgi:hypothetical protein